MPPRIYFHCCPEPDNLQDDIIILAEGLQELGIPYFASHDYWRQSPAPGDYLFKATPEVSPDDCDVVVLPYTWFNWIRLGHPVVRREFPPGLFKAGRQYRTVYMDTNDGHRTVSWEPAFRQFDLILRTKLNRRAWAPANLRPWTLGLSRRMLRMTAGGPPFAQRRQALLVNFGASHGYPHTARLRAEARFLPAVRGWFPPDATRDDLQVPPSDPYDRLMWEQTNHRHCQAYYERLKSTQACACFCGDLIPPLPWRDPGQYLVGGRKARVKFALFQALARLDPRPERIVQWDSWRFWEALAAGCLAFNLDLELYGASLPVMPAKDVHYLGVDLRHPARVRERWADDPAGLERIAAAGRAWALANYSPVAMASRFLAMLGFAVPPTTHA
ncbi:MAG: hypothetical protein KF897_05555 [Opitutaceae bacterium]|nr:hypothetical protein [Opitutaceae bacterium]